MEIGFQKCLLGDVIGGEDIPMTHAEQEPSEGLLQGVDLDYELLSGHRRLRRLFHLLLLIEIGYQVSNSDTDHDGCNDHHQGHDKCSRHHL